MPIEYPHAGQPRPVQPDEKPHKISASGAPSDYQSTLLRIIDSTADDPPQLRRIIYELVRMKLRKEIGQTPALTPSEAKECMLALETAISRVETDCSRAEHTDVRFPRLEGEPARIGSRAPSPGDSASADPQGPDNEHPGRSVLVPIRPRERFESHTELVDGGHFAARAEAMAPLGAGPALTHADKPQVEIVYPERENPEAERARRRVWLWFIAWPLIQLIGPIVFCLAIYLALTGQLGRLGDGQQQPNSGDDAARAQGSGLPLPSAFGVYAISNGALNELEPLPIKAPDPRIALSAEINKPSRTLLPDGKVVFVVFGRDLVNSAPQKVAVRVVARVARAVTLSVGKAVSVDLDSSWRIRSNAYDFKVSPLAENREMIAIRPEEADLALPAGRYAVVLGGLGYDFTVDGPVTAAAQCLESFEALNGPVFSECRTK